MTTADEAYDRLHEVDSHIQSVTPGRISPGRGEVARMSAPSDLPPCPEFIAACERGDVFHRDPRPLGPDGFTLLASESVENARRAEQAERRAEDAEAEVERLRDQIEESEFHIRQLTLARDRAERLAEGEA